MLSLCWEGKAADELRLIQLSHIDEEVFLKKCDALNIFLVLLMARAKMKIALELKGAHK